MTLHWWMHWFWITCLTIPACLCNPTPATLTPTSAEGGPVSLAGPVSTIVAYLPDESVIPLGARQPPVTNSRAAKAIGHFPKSTIPVLPSPQPPDLRAVSITFPQTPKDDGTPSLQSELSIRLRIATTPPVAVTTEDAEDVQATEAPPINVTTSQPNVTLPANNTIKNDTAIETIDNSTVKSNNTSSSVAETEESSKNDSSLVPMTIPLTPPTVNETEAEELEVSTAKALSLETTVERREAGGNVVSGIAAQGINNGGGNRLDAAAVAGICFGCLVIVALSGAVGFVLYRRRYLNKPQTLNDKCSNPDSSGYIDDSTIRENSEEMYSLDNDSFLNSLEAMTIQNYWTDSVKHTKL